MKVIISKEFYGGKLVNIEHATDILSECQNFNIVGKNIISKAITCGIVHESSIRKIKDVPMALKMSL